MADPNRIATIVELIRELSPSARRDLVRRLRVSGLLAIDEVMTDRRKMVVAPAVGKMTTAPSAPPLVAPKPQSTLPPSPQPAASGVRLRMAQRGSDAAAPAISGRVVLGSPQQDATDPDPHGMAPLPGRAPEQPIVIVLRSADTESRDGSSAAYMLHWPGNRPQSVQVRFSGRPSPDQATYDMLEAALQAVMRRLRDNQAELSTARVEIYCTSDRLIDELIGEEPVGDARLMTQHDRVVDLLDRFEDWRLLRTGDPGQKSESLFPAGK